MTREQFEALKVWIVAIVDEKMSHDSSDGGLQESIRLHDCEKDAMALLVDPELAL